MWQISYQVQTIVASESEEAYDKQLNNSYLLLY
jgi:hypothetical protein